MKTIKKHICLCLGILTLLCSGATWADTCSKDITTKGIHYFNGIIQGIYNRSYKIYVPENVADGTQQASAIVLDFHGMGSSKSNEYELSCWKKKADSVNAVVVYPNGIGTSFNAGVGCCGLSYFLGINDVWYSQQVIERTKEHLCLDDDIKVYATGWSNGGKMAARLACEANQDVDGVANISQSYALEQNDICFNTDQGETPLPVIEFRARHDEIVWYNGDTPYSHSAANSMVSWGNAMGLNLSVEEDASGTNWATPSTEYVANAADPGICQSFEGGSAKLVQCSYMQNDNSDHNLFNVEEHDGVTFSVCDTAWEFLENNSQ